MEKTCPRELLSTMITGSKDFFSSNTISDAKKIDFIREYLHKVERLCDKHCNIIYFRNPLSDDALIREDVIRFEKEALQFLIGVTKKKNSEKNKEVTGDAYAFIGMAYEFGVLGVKQNIKKAISFYSVAATNGNTISTYRLAVCYEKDLDNQGSIKKALSMYRAAAKLGSPEGLHTYGCIQLNGYLGSKPDTNSGILYLKMSTKMADPNYPFPYFDLAQACENSDNNPVIMPDENYMFKLYYAGAELGDANCQFRVAECYCNGELSQGVNLNRALEWYKRAAEKSHIEALYLLAEGYFTGTLNSLIPIEKDINKAYTCAVYAAARMHTNSMRLLADILINSPMSTDTLQAYFWIQTAMLNGKTDLEQQANKLKNYLVEMENEAKKRNKK